VAKTELVRRARDGDRDAYDVLVTESVDGMYRVARLVLRDYDRAADAVQEALVRCWRDLPQLRDPERFDAWLNRILLRAITEEARKRRRDRIALTVVPIARILTRPPCSRIETRSGGCSVDCQSSIGRSSSSITTSA
jgi:RNA polymerase sigma-70 factor (ECF subfamily)